MEPWLIRIVLRLFPPVPFNSRTANKNTVLPSGGGLDGSSKIVVEKGALVVYSTWASHRISDAFGETFDAFAPERWEKLGAHPPGFMPFNGGPRVCPGREYYLSISSLRRHGLRSQRGFRQPIDLETRKICAYRSLVYFDTPSPALLEGNELRCAAVARAYWPHPRERQWCHSWSESVDSGINQSNDVVYGDKVPWH